MARLLQISFFATILVLANFVLLGSALSSFEVKDHEQKKLHLTEHDIVKYDGMTKYLFDRQRSTRFIGDLIFGSPHENQTLYSNAYIISNPSDSDVSGSLSFTVKEGIINLVAVLNQSGSYMVVCDTPQTLGSSVSIVNVRLLANSESKITVIIAAH